jgi:hypothetical protein
MQYLSLSPATLLLFHIRLGVRLEGGHHAFAGTASRATIDGPVNRDRRRALADPEGVSAEMQTLIEAELVTNGWLHAETQREARQRLRSPVVDPPPLPVWRVNAAMAATLAGRPAHESKQLLGPVLEENMLTVDDDSLVGTIATIVLIANNQLDVALRRCQAIIDTARPRGWLIALAHGSQLRAMALTRAGQVRDAEADARLAFDNKLPVTPRPALLWALHFFLDALVEAGELAAAEKALAAAGLGEPPAGLLAARLVLQGRARLRLAQGRPADARTDLFDAAARWSDLGCCHPVLASWRIETAEALVRLGDVAGARELAAEQLGLADRLDTPGARGAALRAMAGAAPLDQRIVPVGTSV